MSVPANAETFSVPANGAVVWSSALEAGQEYQIKAEGTYGYSYLNIYADAEWHFRSGATVWTENFNSVGGSPLLDLLINDTEYNWLGTTDNINFSAGTFSPNHVYILDSFIGTGSFKFQNL